MIKPIDSLCDDVEMYAIGGLDAEAAQQFEHHLSHCEQCRRTLEELQPIITRLPLAVDSVEPPAGMRQRILAAVLQSEPATDPIPSQATAEVTENEASLGQTQQHTAELQAQLRKRWIVRVMAGVAASFVILSGFLLQQVNHLRNEAADLSSQLEQLQQQIAAAESPAAASQVNGVVSLKPAEAGIVAEGRATISVDSKGMHLIVQVEQLPKLQGNEAFQVWLLKDGKPVNAGTFLPNEGVGALYFTFNPDEYDQIAITQEPDANGVEPRGSMVLAGVLSQSETSSS
ncbi:hypothetical protein BBD42_30175 [Paenibacillus sp. BIHB 4019]|uniref:Anti-sigma-W factor RsiW n=1 Tax=Paenibacillus sp. BIHB 4019 TaxID=1870819 RepID=A0A1B2DRF3_9BACL|nr:anti-sigma factor [Paenibacillus sp. BIHB 4019]ANY70289.1 hypothetical protein BBD42_30175 [Paenibacillus sp. BIHB 4019]